MIREAQDGTTIKVKIKSKIKTINKTNLSSATIICGTITNFIHFNPSPKKHCRCQDCGLAKIKAYDLDGKFTICLSCAVVDKDNVVIEGKLLGEAEDEIDGM